MSDIFVYVNEVRTDGLDGDEIVVGRNIDMHSCSCDKAERVLLTECRYYQNRTFSLPYSSNPEFFGLLSRGDHDELFFSFGSFPFLNGKYALDRGGFPGALEKDFCYPNAGFAVI